MKCADCFAFRLSRLSVFSVSLPVTFLALMITLLTPAARSCQFESLNERSRALKGWRFSFDLRERQALSHRKFHWPLFLSAALHSANTKRSFLRSSVSTDNSSFHWPLIFLSTAHFMLTAHFSDCSFCWQLAALLSANDTSFDSPLFLLPTALL